MPMTVVVTRDVPDRYRGFLSSIMPEVAPGVFVAPNLSRGVRERVWAVLSDWWDGMPGGSILLTWRDNAWPSGLGLLVLGLPRRELADLDGMLLVRRN
ncbi:type I-E CRISPR-associated endoribonuclease Cas2e [Siccirubricoccus sp. KC 17139]|uniref:Type I-E CRISPR-associated endoribonuclease Cas2e n=1 Tax=Siccirubricoccus soli TaxID=2899147 RepID=A0ABT1D4A2_9PROT|nr:type I-E CRISPR-associated endoribonuclease Cas2e [Siccirubricoccus soli]MCO6416039.1 type I-E CRISPR-associated endoribonuclease Cas2e [Siccirubricoccus soli]MCP2682171.1 type I-E CRISPR-associated endoribonuclease Cas2e [Siccirubricoccus soli]